MLLSYVHIIYFPVSVLLFPALICIVLITSLFNKTQQSLRLTPRCLEGAEVQIIDLYYTTNKPQKVQTVSTTSREYIL